MSPPNPTILRRWLAAERSGRDAEAEAALFELIGGLPMAAPAAGFADRVLARAGVAAAPRLSRGRRFAVAAGLLAAGLAAFVLPFSVRLIPSLTPSEIAAALADGLAALVSALGETLAFGQWLAGLLESGLLVATSPPVLLTLLAAATVAAAGYRWLNELLSTSRSPGYA